MPDVVGKDPRVAFGICATAVALRVRTSGCCTKGDLGDLIVSLLGTVPEDARARDEVTAFVHGVGCDPVAAASQLQDFILKWIPPEPVCVPHYGWQDRRDCGVD